MANISGLLGTAGGFKGTGVNGPSDMGYVNAGDTNQSLTDTKNFIGQQQGFVNALQAQNGFQNQSSVFNQQQALANQMQGVANGTGPNPALAQLNQATGNNVANQAALMAGQRGSSANPGLLARLAAQQGGNIQQQAAGQGATLQAQQQLSGMNALAQQQASMGNMANTQTGNLLNQANAVRGAQQDLYGTQVTGGLNTQNGINNANTGLISATQQQQAAIGGQAMSGISGAIGYGSSGGGGGGSSGGKIASVAAMAHGGAVDGEVPGKAPIKGDSSQNDIVNAKLSPGEIVIPRSIAMHPDAPQLAMEFVKETLEKQKMACGGMAKSGYADGGDVAPEVLTPEQQADKAKLDERIGQVKDFGSSFKNFLFGTPEQRAALNPEMTQPQSASQTAPQSAPVQNQPSNVNLGAPPPQQSSMFQMPKDYNPTQGLDSQIKGIKGQAQAEGELAKAQVPIFQDAQKQQAELTNQSQQNAWNYDQDMQNTIQAVKDKKIDPNRYINNQTSGQKVLTAISLILGGIGAGMSGTGKNVALDFLNQQIDNDIKAQEKDMANGHNIMAAMNQQFQNKQDAIKMTRSFYLSQLEDQIKEEAAKVGTPIAQNRALQAIGPIQQQIQQIHAEVGMRQAALQSMQNGGDASPAVKFLVPANEQPKAYDELNRVQNLSKQRSSILGAFDQANKENTVGGRASRAGFEPASVGAMQTLMMPYLKDAEGRINESELQRTDKLIPRPGDTPTKVLEKRQALIKFMEEKSSSSLLKGYGLEPKMTPMSTLRKAK